MHLQTLFLYTYMFNYLLKISALMFRGNSKYLYFIGDLSSSKLAPSLVLFILSNDTPLHEVKQLIIILPILPPSFLYLSLSLFLYFTIDPSAATLELSLNDILNLTSHKLHESFLIQAASITYYLDNSNRLLLDLPASILAPYGKLFIVILSNL